MDNQTPDKKGLLSEERIAELTTEAMDGMGCQSSRAGHLIEDSIFNAIQQGIDEAFPAACVRAGEFLDANAGEAELRQFDKRVLMPSEEALRYAREFIDEPDLRAQVKVKMAIDGHPLISDMIGEAVVMARELIRLAEQTPSARGESDLLPPAFMTPTSEMLNAGGRELRSHFYNGGLSTHLSLEGIALRVFDAMRDAAPSYVGVKE